MLCFDNLFDIIGGFGSYQSFLLMISSVISTWSVDFLTNEIIMKEIPHRCRFPYLERLDPYLIYELIIPIDEKTNTYDHCNMYIHSRKSDNDYATMSDYTTFNRTIFLESKQVTKACDEGWTYDLVNYTTNAFSRYNLVCDNAYYKQMCKSVFIIGVLIGSVVSGPMADEFGRKKMSFCNIILKIIGLAMPIYSDQLIVFGISRFIVGFGNAGLYLGLFVLLSEMVGVEQRLFCGVFYNMCFSLGQMIITMISYYLKGNDRSLHIVVLIPNLFFLGIGYYLLESPRWLMTHPTPDHITKSDRIIRYIAFHNRNKISKSYRIDQYRVTTNQVNKDGILDLFKVPRMRKRVLILYYVWFVTSMIYYTIQHMFFEVGKNEYGHKEDHMRFYRYTFCGALVDIGAYFICIRYGNKPKYGRRYTTSLSLLVCSALLVIINALFMIIGEGNETLAVTMVVRLFCTVTYNMIFTYTIEILPTVVRSDGLGTCSAVARVGTLLGPFIHKGMLMIGSNDFAAYSILGVMALIASFLTSRLPETIEEPLCETIESAERFLPGEWQRYDSAPKQMGPVTVLISVDSSPESSPSPSFMKFSKINDPDFGTKKSSVFSMHTMAINKMRQQPENLYRKNSETFSKKAPTFANGGAQPGEGATEPQETGQQPHPKYQFHQQQQQQQQQHQMQEQYQQNQQNQQMGKPKIMRSSPNIAKQIYGSDVDLNKHGTEKQAQAQAQFRQTNPSPRNTNSQQTPSNNSHNQISANNIQNQRKPSSPLVNKESQKQQQNPKQQNQQPPTQKSNYKTKPVKSRDQSAKSGKIKNKKINDLSADSNSSPKAETDRRNSKHLIKTRSNNFNDIASAFGNPEELRNIDNKHKSPLISKGSTFSVFEPINAETDSIKRNSNANKHNK